ncbi:MAG: Ig-like domain-containing protein, partial [Opitutaceae bacterium]
IASSMIYLSPSTTVQGAPLIIPFSATPPAAPGAPQTTPVGGTVVAEVLNLTNTSARFSATVAAGEATGGIAELRWGGRVIAIDGTIAAGDTSVTFDLNTSGNAELRTAFAGAGPLTVNLVSAAGLSSAASPAGNLRTDFSAPTVEITADRTTLLQGQTSVVTFTLSEASPDFGIGAITVTGGGISGFSSVSATQYRGTFKPSDNSAEPGLVSVAGSKFRDAAGNPNAVAAELRLVVDTNPQYPVITVGSAPVTGVYGGAFEYRISATRSPVAFTATGLPAGLSIDATSGIIRGAPRQTGSFSVALGASNAAGSGSATLTLQIDKAVLTVTARDATRVFGAANPQFPVNYDGFFGSDSAAVLRGLPVVSTSATAGSDAGTYDLMPSGAESEFYQFTYVKGRLTITPAPVILSFESLAQAYTGRPLSPVVLTSVPGIPFVVTYNGSSAAPVNVGAYAVTATAGGGNYSGTVTGEFIISRGSQFINLRLVPAETVLNGSTEPVQVLATSSAGLPVVLSVDAGSAASLDADGKLVVAPGASGTVTVRARQGGDANVAASTDAVLRLNVGKRNQQLSVDAPPSLRYGDGLQPLVGRSTSGLPLEFDIMAGPGNLIGRDTLQITGAGVIVIRARQAGDDTFNPAPDLTFEVPVAPRLQTIDFPAPPDPTYGDKVQLAAASSSGLAVSFQVVSGPGLLSGSSLGFTGIGVVVVRATQKGDEGTLGAQPVERSFTVQPRALAVSAVSASRFFGVANPPLLLSYAGFAPGEGAEVFSAAPAVSTDATASSAPGEYTIVVSGGAAANYVITRANGKLMVLKAPQTISFPAIPDQTAGNLPLQLSVSADSGRIPDLVVVSGPATLSGSSLALSGVGRVVIRASLPGNADYEAAPEVERAFSIFNEVVVVGVTSAFPNGAHTVGAVIPVQVVFSAPVVVSGTPVLALNAGAATRALYSAGSGTKVLTFNYTVVAGDSAEALDYTSTGSLTGGELRGAAGAAVISILPAPGGGGSLAAARVLRIDTLAPSLLRLEIISASGSYSQGQRIDLRAVVSEPLQATGGLDLALSTGARVTLSPVAGEAQLRGSYLIGSGENTRLLNATGIAFAAGQPPRDPAGNALVLLGVPSGTANLAGSKTISIGNPGPSVDITADRLLVTTGGTVRLRFSMSEEAVGFGVEDVGVENGVLSGFSGSGREYSAVYTPLAGVKGEGRVWVEANRFTDRAGNGNLAGELRLLNEVKYAWSVVAG